MRLRRAVLWLLALLVPRGDRPRWREEWRAELQHGSRRMILGALPDAWALRRMASTDDRRAPRPAIFHALDQDVRYALRTLGTGKAFTLAVVGSLAIGIAATTTAFALVNATLLRPFPEIRAQEELVRVTLGPRQRVWIQTAWDDHEVLRQGLEAVTGLSVAHDARFAVAHDGGGEPRTAGGLVVSGNYFDVLGVRPALGRFFSPEEDAVPWANPAVVIGHPYWQRDLFGDPEVLQRTINVNGVDLPIVGVAPEGFAGVFAQVDVQLWITFALSDLVFRDEDGRPIQARAALPFHATVLGRLKPSATIDQAQAQAAGLAPALASMRDRGLKELFVRVEPLRIADPATFGLQALALMVVPLIVLAIACVNAANLLLARATRQSGDWLVRLALGASRWRLIRQILVESLLLALAGGALGLLLSVWSARAGQNLTFAEVVIDGNVVLFALGAAIATALVFGLGPALSVTRAAVTRAPEAGRAMRGPFGSRARSILVVVQAALCLGLLATGAQFTKTLWTLWDDGLPDAGQFLSVSLDLDQLRYERSEAETFYGELLARVEQLPSVRAAALTDRTAVSMLGGWVGSWGVPVTVAGASGASPRGVLSTYATAGFFEAMGLSIATGRGFLPEEHRGAPRAVIVNQTFAERAFGDDTVGRLVTLTAQADSGEAAPVDAMVVGVLADPSARPIFKRLPVVFYPAPLTREPALDLLVRFDGGAGSMAAAVRTIVSALDRRVPIGRIATGEDMRRRRNVRDYTLARSVSVLGILALTLAAAGLYGVVSFMVTLRQKEIGIRKALGAAGGSVLRLVVRQSIVPVLVGCALGAVGAVIAGTLIRSHLYGVSPMDPVAFGGAALLLLLTMLVASLEPARRASRVDPITVLRQE
jgi:predicted permease